ncbi:MAG: hypothetical protein MUE58_12040 [Chitinophagaceae bacterium]|jgi:hypothetical protein|nr:hypothetical protein [Chitinophagaceae bacterium]
MDTRIVDLFIKENDAWDDMITRQRSEIPTLEKMLNEVIREKKEIGEHTLASVKLLKTEMQAQEKFMGELKEELAKQQHLLVREKKSDGDQFPINSVSSQNILRERIRNVERTFIELKCNFLNYMATFL